MHLSDTPWGEGGAHVGGEPAAPPSSRGSAESARLPPTPPPASRAPPHRVSGKVGHFALGARRSQAKAGEWGAPFPDGHPCAQESRAGEALSAEGGGFRGGRAARGGAGGARGRARPGGCAAPPAPLSCALPRSQRRLAADGARVPAAPAPSLSGPRPLTRSLVCFFRKLKLKVVCVAPPLP